MNRPESNYRAWLAKAANDMLNIENNLSASSIPWDTVCFHAQQAAEKTLKAFLAFYGLPLTRTHDLVALLTQCVSEEHTLANLEGACLRLTYYAIASRYPDDFYEPDEREGTEMVALSRVIQKRILTLLPS